MSAGKSNADHALPTLIVVCGPTVSGKTRLAVELASHFQTDILSSDSRQFYRDMSIGTAKPTKEEMRGVKHWFIDTLSIEDNYDVGRFEQEALATLEYLFQQKNVAIMAGGSGLFIRAVCEGLDEFPAVPSHIRENLNQRFEEKGLEYLQQELQKLDPEYFEEVDQKNPVRLIRALEVCYATGQPFSSFRKRQASPRPFRSIKLMFDWDREILYERINRRVDLMLDAGLVEEVRGFLPFREMNALQTLGYQELFPYFDGDYPLEEAIRLIKRNTRRYAKRQLTWFRKEPEIQLIQPDRPVQNIIAQIERLLNDPTAP